MSIQGIDTTVDMAATRGVRCIMATTARDRLTVGNVELLVFTDAVATRARLLDRIEAEGITLASCHFPHPGFGRVIRVEGRRYWQAL